MSEVETEARSEYRVEESKAELSKERPLRYLLWGLIAAAVVVIIVFATLLLTGAGA